MMMMMMMIHLSSTVSRGSTALYRCLKITVKNCLNLFKKLSLIKKKINKTRKSGSVVSIYKLSCFLSLHLKMSTDIPVQLMKGVLLLPREWDASSW